MRTRGWLPLAALGLALAARTTSPNWPVFVTYDPPAGTPAAAANGRKLLASTAQGPWTFFEASWARDFITMSARPGAG